MPNKILTTDNLDVIKEYIYEQDQENGRLYLSKIDKKFDEKLNEIENSFETLYQGVISEVRTDLDKLDAQHQSYEAKVDPELEKFDSKTKSIEKILDIEQSAGKDFSKRLNTIEDKIESIKSNNSSDNAGLSESEFTDLINSKAFLEQMKPSTSAGRAILQNVEQYGKIKSENIIAGDIIGSTIKDKNTSPNWAFNKDGSAQLGGENGITITDKGNIQVGNKFKINFYSNIEGGNDSLLNSIADNVKEKILKEIASAGGINEAPVKNIIDNELLKYNYALEYNTDEEPEYTDITINGNTISIPVIKLKRLDDIEDALGLVKSSEGKLTKKEFTVIDNTKDQLDINKKVDSIDAVSLRESMDSMLETEYEDISKKVDGKDTDYKILKSKRLDDIENLLYINKTRKDGDLDVPYYNIITAIAGNPPGMVNGEVSDKFKYVSEKGVLDMTFEGHEGGVWIPKSNRLNNIESCIGLNKWEEIGKTTEDSNIYTTVVNDIQKDILGNWDITIDQIKGSVNRNNYPGNNVKEALYNLRDRADELEQNLTTVDDNLNTLDKRVFGDNKTNIGLKGELTTEISTLKTDYTTFKEKSNETDNLTSKRIDDLSSMISQLINNASSEAISKAIEEWINNPNNNVAQLYVNKTELTNTLNNYLNKDTASSTYLSKESFTEQIKDYATDNEVLNSITDALEDYYNATKLNAVLQDYVKTTKLTEVLANYAKTTDLTTGTITVKKADTAKSATKATQDASGNVITTTYLAKNDISPSISASGDNIKISVGGKSSSTFAVPFAKSATKATQDASGNVITTTYLTKTEAGNTYVTQSSFNTLQSNYNTLQSNYNALLTRVSALEQQLTNQTA